MAESSALLDALLYVTHPELWCAGFELIRHIKSDEGTTGILPGVAAWPSVYSAVQIIVNRSTPYHRDTNAQPTWFDMLLSLGNYGERGVMSFRNLGLCVPYDSGSAVMLSSQLVVHGVPDVREDRICLAFIMQDLVFRHFRRQIPGWAI